MTDDDFFFDYDKNVENKICFSNLSLLRRDINTCFGKNPNDPSIKIEYIAIWPGTMGILGGIDLLAKFYCGDDSFENSRSRFIKYTEKFIDSKYKEELYQLRNSLLHSFGLFSKGKNSKEYKFILTRSKGFLIKRKDLSNSYCVSVDNLHEKFEASITEFKKIYSSLESFQNFESLFKKYGSTEINKNSC